MLIWTLFGLNLIREVSCQFSSSTCGTEFNGYRSCISRATPGQSYSVEDFRDCFRVNGCAAPTLEDIFLAIANYIPGGGGPERARECLETHVEGRFGDIEQCVQQDGYDWFTLRLTENEKNMIGLMASTNNRAIEQLCKRNKGNVRRVQSCHRRRGIDVVRERQRICNAKRQCDTSNGFTDRCWSENQQMVDSACRCIKSRLLEGNGRALDSIVQCYYNHLPIVYVVLKGRIMRGIRRYRCASIKERFDLQTQFNKVCLN